MFGRCIVSHHFDVLSVVNNGESAERGIWREDSEKRPGFDTWVRLCCFRETLLCLLRKICAKQQLFSVRLADSDAQNRKNPAVTSFGHILPIKRGH